jgi:hypothetical protein
MKKFGIIQLVLIFSLLGGIADAGQFLGSPTPMAKKGKFALEAGYFRSNDLLDTESRTILATPHFAIFWDDFELEQNQFYLQGSYGFYNGSEVFLRIGAADVETDDSFLFGTEFDDDYKVFGTLGVRLVKQITDIWGVGTYAQGTIYSTYEDEATEMVDILLLPNTLITDVPINQRIETDNPSWEIYIAVALQAKVDSVTFYAGPFVNWLNIPDVKGTITISDPRYVLQPISVVSRTDYDEHSSFGGFAGITLMAGEKIRIQVEAQFKDRIAAGGSVGFAF